MTPCLCTNLRLATRRLSAAYDAALAPLGITIGQYFLLQTVEERPSISLTELGQLTELDRSTVGRNVRVLERMGMVRTGRGTLDQREAIVSLTPAGHDCMAAARPIWADVQETVTARLGRQSVDILNGILTSL